MPGRALWGTLLFGRGVRRGAARPPRTLPEPVRVKGGTGLRTLPGGVMGVAVAPGRSTLASWLGSAEGGLVHLWDTRSGRQLLRVPVEFCPPAAAFSCDGSLLATAGGLGALRVRVWELPRPGGRRE